jgi:4-amino-4-deoxy-L-arabinose transferase-like glycosyltransferase
MAEPTNSWRRSAWPLLACLAALALRLHRLAEPLMRWDEGWSVAHASQTFGDVVRIASWEVHPPLFYLLLKPWLALGRDVFVVRCFAVFAGCLAVPLAYRVAHRWLGRRLPAVLLAGLAAAAPALVYYGQVVRMYPLVVVWLLLATWALLRWLDRGEHWALATLGLATAAALYTLYYTAFPLLGMYAYGLVVARRRRGRLVATGGLVSLLYLPWVASAAGGMLARMADASPAVTIMPVTPLELVTSVWTALVFDLGAGGWAALAVLAVLVAALLLQFASRHERGRLMMPLAPLLVATVGIALASGSYYFAPRLFMPAVPFLLLLVAWALDVLARRSRWLFAVGLLALVVTYWPTAASLVYEKNLEVSGRFDPHEVHATLSGRAAPEDLVFFNTLALAGWYEMDRGVGDPPWEYALRWTPIIEPMAQIRPRVGLAAEDYARLWFVLYQGSFGPGRELKDWLDSALYPASMDWTSDSLLLSYVSPVGGLQEAVLDAEVGPGLMRLEGAQYNGQTGPHGEVTVSLWWRALETPLPNCRVVVQVWDETGQVLAHRDVRPGNWEQPTWRWQVGQAIEDRHGLLLAEQADTPLHLAVSIYDSDTGETLPIEGAPFIELGTLVEAPR